MNQQILASSNSVPLDVYEYLKCNALTWTVGKDNCKNAGLCIYLGERNEGLAVGNCSYTQLGEYNR